MNLPINLKSPNNISKRQIGFNSAVKGLIEMTSSLIKLFYFHVECPKGKMYNIRSDHNKIWFYWKQGYERF
jgi:hypothetical protein